MPRLCACSRSHDVASALILSSKFKVHNNYYSLRFQGPGGAGCACARTKALYLLKAEGGVRLEGPGRLSKEFTVERGVKQGSVLSLALFLLVMDPLLRQLQASGMGLSVNEFYAGGFLHADDIRALATSEASLETQVNEFASKVGRGNSGHGVIRATSTLQQEKKHPFLASSEL